MIVVRICLFLFLPLSMLGQLTVKLRPETAGAFDRYVLSSETAMKRRWEGEQPFLMMDESKADKQRVRSGGIYIRQITPKGGLKVPGGIIHDWAAALA